MATFLTVVFFCILQFNEGFECEQEIKPTLYNILLDLYFLVYERPFC